VVRPAPPPASVHRASPHSGCIAHILSLPGFHKLNRRSVHAGMSADEKSASCPGRFRLADYHPVSSPHRRGHWYRSTLNAVVETWEAWIAGAGSGITLSPLFGVSCVRLARSIADLICSGRFWSSSPSATQAAIAVGGDHAEAILHHHSNIIVLSKCSTRAGDQAAFRARRVGNAMNTPL
jgi:hypothetical protein